MELLGMSGFLVLPLAVVTPLIGAILIGLLGAQPNQRETATFATAITLLIVVLSILYAYSSLAPATGAGPAPTLRADLWVIVPGISLIFEVEPLGMTFALVASSLWIANSAYSVGYMRGNHESNQTRFFICFAIALSATMGIAFAGNLFTLFVFYEVLTLSTYPLVTHKGDADALRSGRTYLGILMGTSILVLLLAVFVTWTLTGRMDFTPGGILGEQVSDSVGAVLLVLYMFGIGKAALMPFHRWLPAAMVAPTPVSALLHAVAVVKAGVFSVVKVVVYIIGIDRLDSLVTTDFLMYLAAFTVLASSVVAMRQDNLKRRLAYSTISQLSYVVVGALLGTKLGALGGAMHIPMHAFGKITLFFCAGAIYTAHHKTKISEMNGLGRVMPVTMAAFFLGALSVIGIPPLGGSWSKFLLAVGAVHAEHLVIVAVLMISSLLNVAYLLGPVFRAFFRPPHENSDHAAHPLPNGVHEAPMACVVPLALTGLGCIVLFVLAPNIYDALLPLVEGASR